MEHKNLEYHSPEDLITPEKLITVERAWLASVAHQITNSHQPEPKKIIETVANRIQSNVIL